jgi:hypothetical protein
MRFLSTKTHGVIDYLVGLLLIAAPWIFGFARGGIETWIFIICGAGALMYSLITNYEMGAVKMIPMPVHLLLDAMSGIVLAVSPWLFGFSDFVYLPHLIFGLFEVGASLITHKQPAYQSSTAMDRR